MHKTALYDRHIGLRARISPFAGWEMPLHYGSQLQEHLTVRQDCGLFDVSHMCVVDFTGGDLLGLLQLILAGDASRLGDGEGRYGLMLNEQGGIIDDLISYRIQSGLFTLVVNAGNREKDLAWIRIHAPAYQVTVTERTDLAVLALQGPNALTRLIEIVPDEWINPIKALPPFHIIEQETWRIARTGYTGEEGFELILPITQVASIWDQLLSIGVAPIGLGARDTLRLEAGMTLYGRDINDQSNPLECGLGWTIAWEPEKRIFIGRHALEPLRTHPDLKKRVGIILTEKGVLRDHQTIFFHGEPIGEITSGGYSPTLEAGIALAIVKREIQPGTPCQVEIRGRMFKARVVRPPFVRMGQSVLRD